MSKPVLVLSSPIATRSGYGEHARDIFASLLKMDKFDIKLLSQRWGNCPMNCLSADNPLHREMINRMVPPQFSKQPDVWIQLTVPNEFQAVGKYNIGITAGVETTLCAPELLEGMNKMNLVIVPSNFSKSVFEQTTYEKKEEGTGRVLGNLKCTVPIEVIFEGIDTSVYKKIDSVPTSIRKAINDMVKEDFCFLSVGHWLNGSLGEDRKNIGLMIQLFLETFKNEPNPPALLLKTSGATFSIMDKNDILNKIEQIKATVQSDKPLPSIYLIHGDLSPEEMNGLYNHNKVKAHVSFTKGEGFGRPLLEASVSEKPIIASNWSGQMDFLNKEFTILIGGTLTNVHPSAQNQFLIKDSQWFSVDPNNASHSMMHVFKNRKMITGAAIKQALYAKQNFSLDKMNEKVAEVMNKYVPEFPEEVKIQLPKLKKIELPKLKKI